MNDDLIKVNHQLGRQIELYDKKLSIAIEGLEAIIFEGSDNLKIAEKTLEAMNDCNKENPQDRSENEQGAVQVRSIVVGSDGRKLFNIPF